MDVIEQILTSAVQELLAKIFGGKSIPHEYYIHLEALEPDDLFVVLDLLVKEKRLCDAEDLLFSQFEKAPSSALYEAGIEIFDRMNLMDETELAESDYSRKEIEKARADFIKLSKSCGL